MYAYHVTTAGIARKILKHGLLPGIGKRSRQIEKRPAIHLFKTYDDVENALMNWLGEEFGENIKLALLRVKIPYNAIVVEGAGYEIVVLSRIPAKNIKMVMRNI